MSNVKVVLLVRYFWDGLPTFFFRMAQFSDHDYELVAAPFPTTTHVLLVLLSWIDSRAI